MSWFLLVQSILLKDNLKKISSEFLLDVNIFIKVLLNILIYFRKVLWIMNNTQLIYTGTVYQFSSVAQLWNEMKINGRDVLPKNFYVWPIWQLEFSQFNSVQLLSCVQFFATPWTAARQASLSVTNSHSLLKLMSIMSVIPSLLLLPSIFPSIRVFSRVYTH